MKKNIVILGASSGIGLALAKSMHSQGAHVHAISRTKGELPAEISHHHCDILQDNLPSIDQLIDGLVYMPGSMELKPFGQTRLEDFRNDIEINLIGAIKTIQHFLPKMKEGASVVLMSSVAARVGLPFHSSIASSKGAIESLTLALAAEFAPKVRINCVAPSLTDTPLAEKLLRDEKRREASSNRHPLKRIGTPEEIAETIAYLLSDSAKWITGQIHHVDGGFSTLK